MKKKILKILAALLAFAIIAIILSMLNAFVGNPISKDAAKKTAENLLKSTYADKGYVLEDVNYSFKFNEYLAFYRVPGSKDKHFSVYIRTDGTLRYDGYESVLDGSNTYIRIDEEYSDLIKPVIEKISEKYYVDIFLGDIVVEQDEPSRRKKPLESMPWEELEVDKEYDLNALGKKYGEIVVYAQHNEGSFEDAVEILQFIDSEFKSAGINYNRIDFNLSRAPKDEEEKPGIIPDTVSILELKRSEICEDKEKLIKHLKKAHEETAAYYKKMDEEKQKEYEYYREKFK